MDTIKLECPIASFEALHEAVSKTRRTKKVSVEVSDLSTLLRDHAKLWGVLEAHGWDLEVPMRRLNRDD